MSYKDGFVRSENSPKHIDGVGNALLVMKPNKCERLRLLRVLVDRQTDAHEWTGLGEITTAKAYPNNTRNSGGWGGRKSVK